MNPTLDQIASFICNSNTLALEEEPLKADDILAAYQAVYWLRMHQQKQLILNVHSIQNAIDHYDAFMRAISYPFFDEGILKEVHNTLMRHTLPEDDRGLYRKDGTDDKQSGKIIHLNKIPDSLILPEYMQMVTKSYTNLNGKDVEKEILEMHDALLAASPFRRGNGRVARIAYNMMRLKHGLPIDTFKTPHAEYLSGIKQRLASSQTLAF